MAGKKVFMLRVNPEVYEAIEQWAADEFRSVNGQIEWMLDAKLREHKRLKTKSGQTPADNKSNPQ
jgi:hypothetical protein